MDKSIIFIIAGYILYFLIAVGIPVKLKINLKKAGKCIYSFAHFDKIKTVLIYVFSFILIGLVSLSFFALYAKVILELCAILGLFISAKESNFTRKSGIYENGIVCSEGFFLFDDILTLPVLNLSKKERENYSKSSLIIATKSKGKIEIVFENETICEKVVEELLIVCPRLKS